MSRSSRRDLGIGATLAVMLAAGLVIPRWAQTLLLMGAVMLLVSAWTWPRITHPRLRRRIGSTIVAGWLGAAVAMVLSIELGPIVMVLVVSVVGVVLAVMDSLRWRAVALPAQGEASGSFTFEGSAHAIGAATRVPGTDRAAAVWTARQGRRRWSSTGRFELRDDERKVLVERAHADVRGDAWVLTGGLARDAAAELDGADTTRPITIRWIPEGDRVFVVGGVTLQDDPEAPSFRDPGRIRVFSGPVIVSAGFHRLAVRDARRRLVLAGVLAVCASGIGLGSALT
ncbi:MAG: hypothetical protein IPQ07_12425 [Myxococcales bacterium]|nr:hypothetical protein [Myxococcales bacterium]